MSFPCQIATPIATTAANVPNVIVSISDRERFFPELPFAPLSFAVTLPSEAEWVRESEVPNEGEAGPVVIVVKELVDDKSEATREPIQIKNHHDFVIERWGKSYILLLI